MYQKKILFVCLGNICRSPAAEGIMKELIKKEGLEDSVYVDSAGTLAYHEGECADPRMIKAAEHRGYILTHLARKFKLSDFEEFDYIIAMDNDIYAEINSLANRKYKGKIFKMVDFSKNIKSDEVPDPYYSGRQGFETVLDILEDSCKELLERIKNELASGNQK